MLNHGIGLMNNLAKTAVATGGGDPYWSSVVLLVPGGETAGSTTIVDKSSLAVGINNSGVDYSSTQTKFATTSLYFNGTSDSFYLANGTDNEFPGDFTIEFWAYPTTSSGFRCPVGTNSYGRCLISNNSGWYIEADNGSSPVAVTISSATYSSNTWQHIAFTRSGNDFRAFKDGTQFGSTINNSVTLETTANFYFGQFGNGGSYYQGYLEQIRITKGVARYTSNFTAPTAAFPQS